jgi:hypothetical protein
MESLRSNIKSYPGKHIKINIDDPTLNFTAAKKIAKQKAKEMCDDPMLLSWYNGKTGESHPNLECGPGDKTAWIIYAESSGGDLTTDINEGQYVFSFLSSV